MYNEEKKIAKEFLAEHGTDLLVIKTLEKIDNNVYMHSDRWGIVYDMIYDYYPEWRTGGTVTGLVYLVEGGEI